MTKKFLVPLLLPADPTDPLEAATKQYVDASAGGAGDQYEYDWLAATTASDPGVGRVKCNNADPSVATAVYISMYSDLGRAAIFVLDLAVGSRFTLYELADINTFIRYEVSGTVTNNANTWFSIPVTVHQEGTSGFTPGNNQTVMVGPSRSGTSFQPLDADLTTIAGLTASTDNIIQSSGGAWASRTPAQVASTIPIFTDTVKGLVPPVGAYDATKFLNGFGNWAVPAGGGGGEPPVGTKISDLPVLTGAGAATTDLIEVVDTSDTSIAPTGRNKRITLAELVVALSALGITVDADLGSLAYLDQVESVDIMNDSVTNANLANMPALTVKANNQATADNPADLTIAQTKSLLAYTAADMGAVPTSRTITTTAPITIGGAGSADLSANRTLALANDGVTNALLAPMPTLTLKGNVTGATAGPTDLTVAQAKSLLGIDNITVSNTAPSSPAVGDLWVDTT